MRIPILQQANPGIKFLLSILMCFLGLATFSTIGIMIGESVTGTELMIESGQFDYSDPNVVWGLRIHSMIANLGGFGVMAFAFARLSSNSFGRYFHFKQRLKWKYFLVILGLILLALPVTNMLGILNEILYAENLIGEVGEESLELKSALLASNETSVVLFNLLTLALIPAISEELFFRGIILRVIYQGTRRIHAAVPMTAAFFALIHFEFENFLPLTFMGMILGYLYVYTGSIVVPMILHFMNNATYVLIAAYGSETLNMALGSGFSDTIWLAVGFVTLIIMLWVLRRVENKEKWMFMRASLMVD